MKFNREFVGRFKQDDNIQVVNKAIAKKMEETGYTNILTRYVDKDGHETFDLHKANSIYISVEA